MHRNLVFSIVYVYVYVCYYFCATIMHMVNKIE